MAPVISPPDLKAGLPARKSTRTAKIWGLQRFVGFSRVIKVQCHNRKIMDQADSGGSMGIKNFRGS